MDIHNASEEIVYQVAKEIFSEIKKSGNPYNYCLCEQCQVDTICYTLNRVEPFYITSNRGLTRVQQNGTKRQQTEADVTTLIYKGLQLVNHNKRPTTDHDGNTVEQKIKQPLFDIPTISGRIFDGITFEPIVGIHVSLFCEGELVQMRNHNWQNPYTMIMNSPGAFSFWPIPITAGETDLEKVFNFSIKINTPDYELLNHFFNITIVSKFHNPHTYALNRTYKLPDLYLFPPGEAEQNG